MFELNEYDKVEGSSLVYFLWVEVGTEIGPCDGIADGVILVICRDRVRDRLE